MTKTSVPPKVVITLTQGEDGVNVNVWSHPDYPKEPEDMNELQVMAMAMVRIASMNYLPEKKEEE